MEKKILRLNQIKPIDGPRKKSLDYFRQSWGEEGPPEEIIDLTCFTHHIICHSGEYLPDDMNHRLGFLYERYGGNQKVKVNFVKREDNRPDYEGIIEERNKLIERGILSWNEWLNNLK